jgi:hypothetical protein
MGGFAGYHVSKLLTVPALLFNPALSYRNVFQNVPLVPESNKSTITIVLGSKDNIINPSSTLSFLGNLLMQTQNYNIHIQHELEHRIPIKIFEYEVNKWMENLNIIT